MGGFFYFSAMLWAGIAYYKGGSETAEGQYALLMGALFLIGGEIVLAIRERGQ